MTAALRLTLGLLVLLLVTGALVGLLALDHWWWARHERRTAAATHRPSEQTSDA